MMESLENINPSQVKGFFAALCTVLNKHEKKRRAVENLDSHIKTLEKYPQFRNLPRGHDISSLKSKISEVINSERRILSHKQQMSAKEMELVAKIKWLEKELEQVKKEKQIALEENSKKIHELNAALLSIKSRMDSFIDRKS